MKPKNLLPILLAVPLIAVAGVNPQNGDYYITYGDIALQSGGHELNLDRTYNSLAPELGWFGYGWGSPFETRLIAMPDGSAAVQEHGTGQINYYRAREKADIQGGVARIVEAATRRDKLSQESAAGLREALVGDEELRVRKVLHYGLQTDLPVNVALQSNECRDAALVRMAESYRRSNCDRSHDYFDLQGHLIRSEKSDGYSVAINYAGKRPASIKDTLGQTLALKWTDAGLLSDATSGTQHHIIYTYDKNNNLALSNDVNGNSYGYEYDDNHNMTRVIYGDKTTRQIEYFASANGVAKSVTDRMGEKAIYEYGSEGNDRSRGWTRITEITASGKQSIRTVAYQRRRTETGAEQLASIAASSGNRRVETIFDGKGRIIRKANDGGGFSEYIYHPKSDKLILVLSNDLKTVFHYDERGNLVRAENSNGRLIELGYADSALIQRMVDVNRAERTRHELTFQYNAAGRPTEITLVGTGKIVVAYDDKGEMTGVTSGQGAKMALQVTAIFQDLLSVVAVAGARF